jgi:hypothetical protein
VGGQFRLEFGPQVGVGAGELEVLEHRPHVQARTADQQRHPAPSGDGLDRGPRDPLVLGDTRRFGHIPEVQRVVRHALPLLRAQLGGPDVHAAVELHRVGVDDLAAQTVGQGEAEGGLAGRRGPDDRHDDRPRDRGSHRSLQNECGSVPSADEGHGSAA